MLNIVTIHRDQTLVQLLKKVILHEPDWFFLMEGKNFETIHDNFPKRARIDVAIMDATEIGHIKDLQLLSNQVKIIVLANIVDTPDALKSFHYGAVGYISIADFVKEIPHFIKIVIEGGVLISPIVARHLINSLTIPMAEGRRPKALKNTFNLTPKEIEVIHLVSMGYSYDKMASVMGISKNGVRFHVKNIYAKLQVNNRVEAARKWNSPIKPLDPEQEG